MVLGLQGAVLAAVTKLRHNGSFRLVKGDGTGAGTRHSAGMGVAEWMGRKGFLGVVFVASDSGTVSVMFPCGLQPPQVLQVSCSASAATRFCSLRATSIFCSLAMVLLAV